VLGLLVGMMQTTACCDVFDNDSIHMQAYAQPKTIMDHNVCGSWWKYQKVSAHLGGCIRPSGIFGFMVYVLLESLLKFIKFPTNHYYEQLSW